MKDTPKVSVVVPAYNAAKYLPRCVESILQQTNRSLEVLVINDGSTDNTATIADDYALRDSRVKVSHQSNAGVSAARNCGLDLAKGEFVCFIDSDDWVEPNMLEEMISYCDQVGANMAMAGAHVDFHSERDELLRSEKRVLGAEFMRRGSTTPTAILEESFINLLGYAWNKVYRREWLLSSGVRFDVGRSLFEDADFNMRLLAIADHLVLVPEAFVHYVQRPRESLGSVRDEKFLSEQLHNIDRVDHFLTLWGVDDTLRNDRRARASGAALWAAIRAVSLSPNAKTELKCMAAQPGAERLTCASLDRWAFGWRGAWAITVLRRRWYSCAVVPLRIFRIASGKSRR